MKTATPIWLIVIALFGLLAATVFQSCEIRRNNQLLERQASYVHVQHKLESNHTHFILVDDAESSLANGSSGATLAWCAIHQP